MHWHERELVPDEARGRSAHLRVGTLRGVPWLLPAAHMDPTHGDLAEEQCSDPEDGRKDWAAPGTPEEAGRDLGRVAGHLWCERKKRTRTNL